MNEILVISGKGGAGKTSVVAAFSFLLDNKDIIVDCDVDAADMHILLNPDFNEKFDFNSGKECRIDTAQCTNCGLCAENCHYNAITLSENGASIDVLECEHCLLCYNICPENAVLVKDMHCGEYYVSNTKIRKILVHARLNSGADNSGKLVSTIRTVAKNRAIDKKSEIILIDGPPGIGCPVIASVTGVNYAVLVTEPTVSGLSDLKRAVEIIKHFKIKTGCIINKSTLNKKIKENIIDFCNSNNIKILGELPYDFTFYNALTEKKSVMETDNNNLKNKIKKIWEQVKKQCK